MNRRPIIYILTICLSAMVSCDRLERSNAATKDLGSTDSAQSAQEEAARISELAHEALHKYRKTSDQIEAINAYLSGRNEVLLKREGKLQAERKELQLTYFNNHHKNQSLSLTHTEITERDALLDREITESDAVMKELSFALRELKKLEASELNTQVNSLVDKALQDELQLELLSEIHFQIVTYIERLDRKLIAMDEQLDTRLSMLETEKERHRKRIRELKAAIKSELASFTAMAKRQAPGEIVETMCVHSIQNSAEKEINKLSSQIIGSDEAAIEIEFIREGIQTLKNSIRT